MKIAQNTVVTLDYTLKVDGSLVESTDGDEPMTYLHGHENIVPGLEKALVGLVVGDSKRVLVQPKDGYGEYDEDGVQNLAKTNFEEPLEVAGTYFGETEDGEPISFSVQVRHRFVTLGGFDHGSFNTKGVIECDHGVLRNFHGIS